MHVIPAIDIREGACVQLVGGDPSDEKIHIPDAVGQARRWAAQGAEWVHLVDLDRALDTGNNFQLVKRILDTNAARFSLGGGLRFTEDIDEALDAGAATIVVGTRAVTDEKWFKHVCDRYGDRLVVAIDARDDEIVIRGWKQGSGKPLLAWAQSAAELGAGAFLYTDVGREGRMAGANVDNVRRLVEALDRPVIASGGVGSMEDLEALHGAGAWGAVVGMAAYTGAVDIGEAIKRFAND